MIKACLNNYQERFSDLDAYRLKIRLFENPFDSVIKDLHLYLQMEIIDFQPNDILKDKFKKGNLIEFYKCLPSKQYPYLKKLPVNLFQLLVLHICAKKPFQG